MNLIILILVLLLLFGGVGWYGPRNDWGVMHYGGSVGVLLVVVLLIILFRG